VQEILKHKNIDDFASEQQNYKFSGHW